MKYSVIVFLFIFSQVSFSQSVEDDFLNGFEKLNAANKKKVVVVLKNLGEGGGISQKRTVRDCFKQGIIQKLKEGSKCSKNGFYRLASDPKSCDMPLFICWGALAYLVSQLNDPLNSDFFGGVSSEELKNFMSKGGCDLCPERKKYSVELYKLFTKQRDEKYSVTGTHDYTYATKNYNSFTCNGNEKRVFRFLPQDILEMLDYKVLTSGDNEPVGAESLENALRGFTTGVCPVSEYAYKKDGNYLCTITEYGHVVIGSSCSLVESK